MIIDHLIPSSAFAVKISEYMIIGSYFICDKYQYLPEDYMRHTKKGGVDQTFTEFEKMKGEMEVNEFALETVGYML